MDPDGVVITPAQLAAIHALTDAARAALRICDSHILILESHGLHLPSVYDTRNDLAHALQAMSTDNRLPYTSPTKGVVR